MPDPVYGLTYLERFFAVPETAYGTEVTNRPDSDDAFAAIGMDIKRVQAYLERRDKIGSRTRPQVVAGGDVRVDVDIQGYLIPSGTPATPPDTDELLKNLMGSKTVINTTAVTGSTKHVVKVASATGIAKGTILGITTSGVTELRPVASVAGTDVTMAVDFTADPAADDPVKAVNYALADAAASSLCLYSYITNIPLVAKGVLLGKGTFNFQDQILAMRLTGIGCDDGTPAVGTAPTPNLSGIPVSRSFGAVFLGSTQTELLDFSIEIDNSDLLRDIPIGSQITSGISRGLRKVTDSFRVYVTDSYNAFYQTAKARTPQSLFIQIGSVAGSVVGFWLPTRILQIPDIDKSKPEVQFAFASNYAYGTGNDELTIALG
jgi:hypothetical protein